MSTGMDNAWLGDNPEVVDVQRNGYQQLTISGVFWTAFDPWIRRHLAQDGDDHYVRFAVVDFGMKMPLIAYGIFLLNLAQDEVIVN